MERVSFFSKAKSKVCHGISSGGAVLKKRLCKNGASAHTCTSDAVQFQEYQFKESTDSDFVHVESHPSMACTSPTDPVDEYGFVLVKKKEKVEASYKESVELSCNGFIEGYSPHSNDDLLSEHCISTTNSYQTNSPITYPSSKLGEPFEPISSYSSVDHLSCEHTCKTTTINYPTNSPITCPLSKLGEPLEPVESCNDIGHVSSEHRNSTTDNPSNLPIKLAKPLEPPATCKVDPLLCTDQSEDTQLVSMTNICSFDTSTTGVFGREEGLFVIGDNDRFHPVMTDALLESMKSNLGSNEDIKFHSIEPLYSRLKASMSRFTLSPRVIYLHQYDSSSFCNILQSQFFNLWKPILYLTCSLKLMNYPTSPPSRHSSSLIETRLDRLLRQANIITYIQSKSPSKIFVHLTDCEYFKSVTCFSNHVLMNEAIQKIKIEIQNRLCKLFEDKLVLDTSPQIIIVDDQTTLSNIINDATGDQFSWKEFGFLVYLKCYSRRFHKPVLNYNEVLQIGMLFGISEYTCEFLLDSFQSQQHILILADPHLVVLDLHWLFSGFDTLKSFSIENAPHLVYMEQSQLDINLHVYSPMLPHYLLFHFLKTCRLFVSRGQDNFYFTTIFLPFRQKSNFCYNAEIGSLYILTELGVIPCGFFEKFIASLWQSSLLTLKDCQCRSSATFTFKLNKESDEYEVKISNVKGYVKISLVSVFNLEISYDTLSAVAFRLTTELKCHLIKFLPSDSDDCLVFYFDCHDPRCPHVKESPHLTHVLNEFIECKKNFYKIKLIDLDKSRSFWLDKNLKVKETKSTHTFPKIVRPCSLMSDDLDTPCSPHFVIHDIESHIATNQTSSVHCTRDSIVSSFLENHQTDLIEKLNLKCRYVLCQFFILDESLLSQCEVAIQSTDNSSPISIIIKSVRDAGIRGIVGLVSAIKDSEDDVLYDVLSNDSLYSTIKNFWSDDVLEQFCSS